MTVTYIRWKDACSEEAAAPDTPAIPGLVELQEVGFLLAEDEETVLICMELEPDDMPARWRLHIPKNSIVDRRDMEVDKAFPLRKRKR